MAKKPVTADAPDPAPAPADTAPDAAPVEHAGDEAGDAEPEPAGEPDPEPAEADPAPAPAEADEGEPAAEEGEPEVSAPCGPATHFLMAHPEGGTSDQFPVDTETGALIVPIADGPRLMDHGFVIIGGFNISEG